jgi:hypothetical protein
MGTNTTTTKDEQIQSLANFLSFANKKKKEDNCALEILREKYIFRSSFKIGKFLCF